MTYTLTVTFEADEEIAAEHLDQILGDVLAQVDENLAGVVVRITSSDLAAD